MNCGLVGARAGTHPVNALCDGEASCGVMRGEFIVESHNAIGGCATASAGNGNLCRELSTRKLAWASCDPVFTHRDGRLFSCCRKNH